MKTGINFGDDMKKGALKREGTFNGRYLPNHPQIKDEHQ